MRAYNIATGGISYMATTKDAFNALVNNIPVKDLELTLDQMMIVEQTKLLRSINGKLTFFVVIAVISILISIFIR
jgi:hypothetical protein